MPTLGPGSQGSNYIDRNASSADRTRRNWQRLQNNLSTLQGTLIGAGAGVPAVAGKNGDLFIDTTTGELYQYSTTSNSWVGVGNLTGPTGPSGTAPLTSKGGLLTSTGSAVVQLSVGSNTFVLTADSTQTDGIKWAAAPPAPLTTDGDIYYYNGGASRLAIGTTGQVLTVVAGEPAWATASGGATTGTGTVLTGLTTSNKTVLTISLASAYFNTVGRYIRVQGQVVVTSGAPSSLDNAVYLSAYVNGIQLVSSNGDDLPPGYSAVTYEFNLFFRVIATGSSGTLTAGGSLDYVNPWLAYPATTPLTANLTGTTSIVFKVFLGNAADSGATAQVTAYSVETLT